MLASSDAVVSSAWAFDVVSTGRLAALGIARRCESVFVPVAFRIADEGTGSGWVVVILLSSERKVVDSSTVGFVDIDVSSRF